MEISRTFSIKLFALCLLMCQCAPSIAAETKPILVGVVYAMKLNKEFAQIGRQMVKGTQAQADLLNAGAGVTGRKLKLVVADDTCNPDLAVKVARDLVAKGVTVVIGHCAGSAIAAAPIYEAARIIEISPTATNPYFTEQGWWNVFRTTPRDDQQAVFIGKYIAKHFAGKSIAVANDGSIYGSSLAQIVSTTLNGSGQIAHAKVFYDANKPNYRKLANELREMNADVVFVGGYAPEAARLLKTMRALGLKTQMIGSDSFGGASFVKNAGKAADRTIFSFTADTAKAEEAKPLVQKLRKKGINPAGYTLSSYASLEIWAHAANTLNTIDGKQISAWLRAGNRMDTAIGQISMDQRGDLKEQKFVWYKFSKGRYAEDASIN